MSKLWALELQGGHFFGPIGAILHRNNGAIMGTFSEISPLIRIVSLATGGAFLFFLFSVIQYLLPHKQFSLRAAISLLLGGVLGNVIDRIQYGHVIDFIVVGSADQFTPAFNIADLSQWIGYFLISIFLFLNRHALWPQHDTRKTSWINFRFQFRFCMILISIGLLFATTSGIYSYTFLRATIIDFGGRNPQVMDAYLIPFMISFCAVSIMFSILLFFLGRALSVRIAGPIYAFEKYLDDLVTGNPHPLRIRSRDEFKHLEQVASRVAEVLNARRAVQIPTPKSDPNISDKNNP